ncbi:hypothetical protein [Seonamhaeicola maritimus]|uniref:Uncharacterized protein n=1 Tax=Seonamhaeicola maritimus TaxID=2591822 RepID=A0A5C7GN30_9FLAO|nr:hypothetical protein [Seonamhaeicola maritimus]TXG39688.1 hypothetical protein FUA22_07420 [Seonamhaeicola maritimus]
MGAIFIPVIFLIIMVYAVIKRIRIQMKLDDTIKKFNTLKDSICNLNDSNYEIGTGHLYE